MTTPEQKTPAAWMRQAELAMLNARTVGSHEAKLIRFAEAQACASMSTARRLDELTNSFAGLRERIDRMAAQLEER